MSAVAVVVSVVPLVVLTVGLLAYRKRHARRPAGWRSWWLMLPVGALFVVAAWVGAVRHHSGTVYAVAAVYTAIWIAVAAVGYSQRSKGNA